MTRITEMALNRKYQNISRGMFSITTKRDVPLEAIKKEVGQCPFCYLPVFASVGQMLSKDKKGYYSHKACRKNKGKYI